jgi:hypothetical protein
LLEEMLDTWERRSTEEVIERVEGEGADRLRRVDNRRMDYLRSLLAPLCADEDELEARCLIAFSVAIGNHSIAADHGGRSRADVLEHITRQLFAQ